MVVRLAPENRRLKPINTAKNLAISSNIDVLLIASIACKYEMKATPNALNTNARNAK